MWKEENNKLQRSFEFKDFVEAFTFITKVAFSAEKNGPSSQLEQCVQQSGYPAIYT